MYFETGVTVPIPASSDIGKIIVASTGYVSLQTGYSWDPAKRQPKYTRVSIGKTDPSCKGMMYPSKRYVEFFGPADPEVAEIRRHYDHSERMEAGKLDYHIAYGPFAAVQKACEMAGCLDPLKRAFPSRWRLILAMAVQAVAAESTTAQTFPGWCFDHYCGLGRVVADSEISKMYKGIANDRAGVQTFFTLFMKEFSAKFPCEGARAVAFDSTNQNYYGKKPARHPMATRGHEKIKLNLPIINTAMFVDEKTGIPLWYEHYDGSTLDKTQAEYSLKKIIDLGFRKLFMMYDRGYYSDVNIKSFEKHEGIEFGVLCPDGLGWVEDLILEEGPKIKDSEQYYIHAENVYGTECIHKVDGKDFHAYLFYDAERAEEERKTIHEVFEYYYEEASGRKRYTRKMEADYSSKGILVKKTEMDPETGKNFILAKDTDAIQRLLDMKGFFVMLSPTKLTVPEAIGIVRARDKAEKSFQGLMQHFDLRNTCRHNRKTYEGMMFMSFIALIALCSFMHFEADVLHACTSETVAMLFVELNKYKIEQNKDGSWRPAYAMNKKQKAIFGKLGLTEEEIEKQVYSLKLSTGLESESETC